MQRENVLAIQFFFLIFMYLFGWAVSWLQHAGSLILIA